MTTRPTRPWIDITDDIDLANAAYCLHYLSALGECTAFLRDTGRTYVLSDRSLDALSSGEQILWNALLRMEAGDILSPDDMRTADAGLDQRSRDALRRAANEYALAVAM